MRLKQFLAMKAVFSSHMDWNENYTLIIWLLSWETL